MYETIEELEKEIQGCNKCKLCNGRKNIVFGTGNKNADLMFIGEGPGADEDAMRRAICRKSRETNGHGILWYRNKKGRSIYSKHCKM